MNNNKTVEFNLNNILTGEYAKAHGKKRSSEFKMHNSFRLLLEAGFKFESAEAKNKIKELTYKWTYWTYNNDDKMKYVIISLHSKKTPKDWLYIIVDTKGNIVDNKSYKDLAETKDIMKGLSK